MGRGREKRGSLFSGMELRRGELKEKSPPGVRLYSEKGGKRQNQQRNRVYQLEGKLNQTREGEERSHTTTY